MTFTIQIMGHNSVFSQIGGFFHSAFSNPDSPSQAAAPSTNTPTIQSANAANSPQQLAQEAQAAGASNQVTAGDGLTDEPTTASQSLLGS